MITVSALTVMVRQRSAVNARAEILFMNLNPS